MKKIVHIRNGKIGVFVVSEKGNISGYTEDEKDFSLHRLARFKAVQPRSDRKVEEYQAYKDQSVLWF